MSLRRSSRLAAYQETTSLAAPKETDNAQLGRKSQAEDTQPRKRRKTAASNGKKGRKAGRAPSPTLPLQDLPLDLLFEVRGPNPSRPPHADRHSSQVVGYLDPTSLHHLSRVSRALHSTMMRQSSLWLWKSSYANTEHGLPPMPDDLTIPKFVGFVIDEVCDVSLPPLLVSYLS